MSKNKFFNKAPKQKAPPPPPPPVKPAPAQKPPTDTGNDWEEGQPFGPGSGEPGDPSLEGPSLYFDEASTEPQEVALAALFLVGTDTGSIEGCLPHLKEVLMALNHRERKSKCQGLRQMLGRIRAAVLEMEGELRSIENL